MTSAVHALVQVAMLEEAQPFFDRADQMSEPHEAAGIRTVDLMVGDTRIALAISGIGLVNAAQSATALLTRYPAGIPLISAGTAGGVGVNTAVGDVIISADVINLEADARAFGYQLGQVPGMPAHYQGSAALAEAALTGEHAYPVRVAGMGSGDKFVTAEHAHRIRADFGQIETVDMETVAIAQVAYRFGAPFVSIRAVSDLCAPDGSEFLTHLDGAAERSAVVVLAAIAALPR